MMSSNTSSTIRSRLLEVIKQVTDEARRFKSLEQMTKISGATWRTFWNRSGAPSGEMIEAIAARWPQYAFWLVTGATDPVAGHIAPPSAVGLLENQNEEIPEATEYFQYQVKLIEERKPSVIDPFGLKDALELIDDAWQERIAVRMQPGARMYAELPPRPETQTLSDLLTAPKRTFSEDYLNAREELLEEMRQQKRSKLEALKQRKRRIKEEN
jgi:hypothetical protein